MWDTLLTQAELTLNILRHATLNPRISAWGYLNDPFNFTETPVGPIGSKMIIHSNPSKRRSWDQRGQNGFSICPTLKNYCCFSVIDKAAKSIIISDTVEFIHSYLTQTLITPADKLMHVITISLCAIKDAPAIRCSSQLEDTDKLCKLFARWRDRSLPETVLSPRVPLGSPRKT